MASNPLGDLNILVGGDISPVQSALNSLPSIAAAAAAAVSSSLSSGTAGSDKLTTSAQAASAALGGIQTSATQAAAGLAGVAGTADASASALDKNTAAINRLSGELSRVNAAPLAEIGTTASQVAAPVKQAESSLSDLSSALINVGGITTAATAPIAALGLASIQTAGYFEQAQVSFTTLLGSAEKAAAFLKELTDFAIKTPFEIKGLVDSSRQMLAMGFSIEQILPMLRTLGDTVAGLGLGEAGIKRLTLAFGEMQARGTIAMKEINQMAMAGVPAMDILAKKMDMTHAELMAAIKKRTIESSEAIPLLLAGMNEKFGGLMEAQSHTLLGMWSNVKDQITKTLKAVGDEILPTVKSGIEMITPLLDGVESLARGFGRLPEPVKGFTLTLAGIAVAAGPVLISLGLLAGAADKLITAGPVIANTFRIISGSAASAAPELAAVGVQANSTAVAIGRLDIAATAAAPSLTRMSAVSGLAVTELRALEVQAGATAAAKITWSGAIGTVESALGRLGPLMQIGAYVVLAEQVYDLGTAYMKWSAAVDSLQVVTARSTDQISLMQIQLRQQGIDISELTRQYDQGEISLEKYRLKVTEVVKAFREANPYVESAAVAHTRLQDAVTKAVDGIQDKYTSLTKNLEVAKGVLAQLQEQYKGTSDGAGVLALATKAVDEAHRALEGSVSKASAKISEQNQFTQKLLDSMDKTITKIESVGVVINGKFTPTLTNATSELQTLESGLGSVVEEFQVLDTEGNQVTIALRTMGDAAKFATEQSSALETMVLTLDGRLMTAADHAKEFAGAMQAVAGSASSAASSISAAASASNSFASSTTAIDNMKWGSIAGQTTDLADYLINILAMSAHPGTIGGVTGSTEQIEQQLRKMGYHVSGSSGTGFTITTREPEEPLSTEAPEGMKLNATGTHYIPDIDWDAVNAAAAEAAASQSDLANSSDVAASSTDKLAQQSDNASDSVQQLSNTLATASQAIGTSSTAAAATIAGAVASITPIADVAAQAVQATKASYQAMAAILNPVATQSPDVAGAVTARGGQPMAITIQMVNSGVVAGNGGMQQLANMVGQTLVTQLKNVTGLKLA